METQGVYDAEVNYSRMSGIDGLEMLFYDRQGFW